MSDATHNELDDELDNDLVDDSADDHADDSAEDGDGDDLWEGSEASDSQSGGMGNDHLSAGPGDDDLSGDEGDDDLEGDAGDDYLYGGLDDDDLYGGDGDDYLDGGDGHDVAHCDDDSEHISIVLTADGYLITGPTGDVDTLVGIERLALPDAMIALDLDVDESGGEAALLLGACLGGENALADAGLVGTVIEYFDAGYSLADACELLVTSGVVAELAGGADNENYVEWLYGNVVGGVLTVEVEDDLLELLDSGDYDQATFLAAVAAHEINQENIDLVGLQQTGLVYI